MAKSKLVVPGKICPLPLAPCQLAYLPTCQFAHFHPLPAATSSNSLKIMAVAPQTTLPERLK